LDFEICVIHGYDALYLPAHSCPRARSARQTCTMEASTDLLGSKQSNKIFKKLLGKTRDCQTERAETPTSFLDHACFVGQAQPIEFVVVVHTLLYRHLARQIVHEGDRAVEIGTSYGMLCALLVQDVLLPYTALYCVLLLRPRLPQSTNRSSIVFLIAADTPSACLSLWAWGVTYALLVKLISFSN
jgi:hypothetical protein